MMSNPSVIDQVTITIFVKTTDFPNLALILKTADMLSIESVYKFDDKINISLTAKANLLAVNIPIDLYIKLLHFKVI